MGCELCKMIYVPENPDNVREHDAYHDKVVNGLPSPPAKNKDIVWSEDHFMISVVTEGSTPEERCRAEEAGRFARGDTPYSAEDLFGGRGLETHVFLLHKLGRIIGLAVVDKRSNIWRTSWADCDSGRQPTELSWHPPMWSICFVWMLKSQRRSHLGKTLVEKAIEHLGCNFTSVGWHTSFTDLGEALVKSCCPEYFYIAK